MPAKYPKSYFFPFFNCTRKVLAVAGFFVNGTDWLFAKKNAHINMHEANILRFMIFYFKSFKMLSDEGPLFIIT